MLILRSFDAAGAEVLTNAKRGRPPGSSQNRSNDDELLKEAARRIVFFDRRTPTEAFKELADEEEQAGRSDPSQRDALIRRLQRRWKQYGERLLQARETEQAKAWEFRNRGLKEEAPEIAGIF